MTENEPLTIRQADPASSDALTIFEGFDAYLRALYPAEANHIAPPEILAGDDYYFALAYWKGRPCGCGAFRREGSQYVEIKRIYTDPQLRGKGIARAMMSHLETQAEEEGFSYFMLETGTLQVEALKLYEKFGYGYCDAFGGYPSGPFTLFMEKRLS